MRPLTFRLVVLMRLALPSGTSDVIWDELISDVIAAPLGMRKGSATSSRCETIVLV